MDLSAAVFGEMTTREYLSRVAGYHERATRQWHHTRFIAATIVNVNRSREDGPVSLHELLPLPGDVPDYVPMSLEEFDEINRRLDIRDADLLNA